MSMSVITPVLFLAILFLPVVLVAAFPLSNRQENVSTIPLPLIEEAPEPSTSACPVMLPPYPPKDTRIVGGAPSDNTMAFYMAALFRPEADFRCSAVIIAKRWLLTAAHCNVQTSWTARVAGLGASTGALRNISAVFAADTPEGSSLMFRDIALIQLSTDAPPNATFAAVNANSNVPPVQSFARAIGYGKTYAVQVEADEKLRQVDVPVTTLAYCKSIYDLLTPDKVCAGYGDGGCDSCQGDSGGPLLQFDTRGRPVVVATVSSGRGCAEPDTPGVYMRISAVIDWMKTVGAEFTIAGKIDQVFDDNPPLSPRPTPSPFPSPPPLPTPSQSPVPTVCPVVLKPQPPAPVPIVDRTIGGSLSSPVTASYMVALEEFFAYQCSGVLISKRWLLTVAHCGATTSWIARFGGLDGLSGEQRTIEKVFVPVQTNSSFPGGNSEDIALIRLAEDAPLSSTFVSVNTDESLPLEDSFARVVGYGRTESEGSGRGGDALRQVDLPIVPTADCDAAYDWLTVDRVCAGYANGGCDACFGDGGGPLLQFDEDEEPVIMGLTSGGEGCALAGFPGVYMRVAPFVQWMRTIGAEFKTSKGATQVFNNLTPFSPEESAGYSPEPDIPFPSPDQFFPSTCPVVLPQMPPPSSDRVVGGDAASLDAARFMVALWDHTNAYRCSGVLLSKRWVLTAGITCGVTTDWSATLAQNSTAYGKKVPILDVFNASNGSDYREISLLHLSEDAPVNASFAVVNENDAVPSTNAFARVLGYGSSEVSNYDFDGIVLRQVDIPIVSMESCRDAWQSDFVSDSTVCAGYKTTDCGICWGDDGAPLVQFDNEDRLVVVGVAFTNFECGKGGIPGLYVRTSSVVEWMREVGADFVTADSVTAVFTPAPSATPTPSSLNETGFPNATGTSSNVISGASGGSPAISMVVVLAGLVVLIIGIVIPLAFRRQRPTEASVAIEAEQQSPNI